MTRSILLTLAILLSAALAAAPPVRADDKSPSAPGAKKVKIVDPGDKDIREIFDRLIEATRKKEVEAMLDLGVYPKGDAARKVRDAIRPEVEKMLKEGTGLVTFLEKMTILDTMTHGNFGVAVYSRHDEGEIKKGLICLLKQGKKWLFLLRPFQPDAPINNLDEASQANFKALMEQAAKKHKIEIE